MNGERKIWKSTSVVKEPITGNEGKRAKNAVRYPLRCKSRNERINIHTDMSFHSKNYISQSKRRRMIDRAQSKRRVERQFSQTPARPKSVRWSERIHRVDLNTETIEQLSCHSSNQDKTCVRRFGAILHRVIHAVMCVKLTAIKEALPAIMATTSNHIDPNVDTSSIRPYWTYRSGN